MYMLTHICFRSQKNGRQRRKFYLNNGFQKLHSLKRILVFGDHFWWFGHSIKNSKLKLDEIDEVIMGQVLTSASGQNPARQAAINAGVPIEKTAYELLKRPGVNYAKLVTLPGVGKRKSHNAEKTFVEEQPTVFVRTLRTILLNTPAKLLKEIILVDDGSSQKWLNQPYPLSIHPSYPQGGPTALKQDKFIKCIKVDEVKLNKSIFKMYVYKNLIDKTEHLAFVKGTIDSKKNILVRMHSLNIFSDLLSDKTSELQKSISTISKSNSGAIVIIRNPKKELNKRNSNNKNINKQKILKEYGVGAQILIDLGIRKITLLTKSRKNIVGIDGFGLEVNGTKRF